MNPLINYRYDALDRLIGIDPAGASGSTRVYRNGRVATQHEAGQQHSLMEAGGHLLAQSTFSGNTVVNTLLGNDRQRSVLQSVTGDEIKRSVYTPYGSSSADGGMQSLLGFNGELPDPVTGCYLLGNGYRAYNPALMRFNSPDSMSPFDSGGINSYAYCLGDPINMSDPTGHFSWRSILSIAIAVASIAITVVTLGSGTPLTGPLVFAAVLDIGSDVLGITSTLLTELAPDSKAGSVLGQFSLALSALSFSVPYAAKFAASRSDRAAARFFDPGPVSVARQGAVRVSNGRELTSLSGAARLGRGARNTVALQNRLEQVKEAFKYVKYVGYAVKGTGYVESSILPYFKPPASDGADQAPSTVEAFSGGGDVQQGLQGQGMKVSEFLTADDGRSQAIREF
jgi:RHS repeat-associated protein